MLEPLLLMVINYAANEITNGEAPSVHADSDGNFVLATETARIDVNSEGDWEFSSGASSRSHLRRGHGRRINLDSSDWYRHRHNYNSPSWEQIPGGPFQNSSVGNPGGPVSYATSAIQGDRSVNATLFEAELGAS